MFTIEQIFLFAIVYGISKNIKPSINYVKVEMLDQYGRDVTNKRRIVKKC